LPFSATQILFYLCDDCDLAESFTASHEIKAGVATAPAEVRVSQSAGRLAAFLERRTAALLCAFTVLYFTGTALRAHAKPFEHDELYTLFLSRLSFPELWRALSNHADASPPLINILVKASHACFGIGEVATRIPPMIGFWLLCICLFFFVRRRLGTVLAFTAMLLPFATGAYPYAYDARCYGQILGCCGAALLCWQLAADGVHRRLALPGLALSLGAISFSHYYGPLVYLPLGAGELWRSVQRRKMDIPVWAALLAGLIPVAVCLPIVLGLLRIYAPHPWPTHITDLFDYYEHELGHLTVPALLFISLVAVYFVFRRRGKTPGAAVPPRAIPQHEIAALIVLAALPAACLAVAMLFTHVFMDRYAISGVVGAILLAVIAIARFSIGNAAISAFALIAALFPFAVEMGHMHRFRNPLDAEPLLREAIQRGPVAIDDGLLFFQAWYYLPPELKARVYYVDDPSSAALYTGNNTIDIDFLAMHPWVGIPLVTYERAAAPGKRILIYHNPPRPVWLVKRLLHEGAAIRVEASEDGRLILSAQR
jgi:hypothetical protein